MVGSVSDPQPYHRFSLNGSQIFFKTHWTARLKGNSTKILWGTSKDDALDSAGPCLDCLMFLLMPSTILESDRSSLSFRVSQLALVVKKTYLPMQEMRVRSLGWEDLLEEGMATHSSVLAWRIPWTEEPGRLQSIGSQERNNLAHTLFHPYFLTDYKIYCIFL